MSAVTDRVVVEALDAGSARAVEAALVLLLRDAVDGGASVGFLPPLGDDEAVAYWRSVYLDVAAGTCVLLVARQPDGSIVGTAQLALATRPNARHRAEAMKVIVLSTARRQGVGRALMLALEEHARRHRRTTLVLDTRQGDPSEHLYTSVGWLFAGALPAYARSAHGGLDASAFYYKLLDDSAS